MLQDTVTRRRIIQFGGAGIVTGIAGCLNQADGNGTAGGATAPSKGIDLIPSGTDAVGRIEVGTLLEAAFVKTTVDEALSVVAEQYPDSTLPENYDGAISMINDKLGLDIQDIDVVTIGYDAPTSRQENENFGVVIDSDWAKSDVKDAIESTNGSLTEQTYDGATFYEPESGTTILGIVEEGRYLYGTPEYCKSIVDVSKGDADAVSGEVVNAYESTPSGPIRFSAAVDDMIVDQESSPLSQVETVAGGMVIEDEQYRLVLDLDTDSSDSARQLKSTLNDGISKWQSDTEDMPEKLNGALDILDELNVKQDDTTVPVTYTASSEEASDVGLALAAIITLNEMDMDPEYHGPPGTRWEWSWDGDVVTLEHGGGDDVNPANFEVVDEDGQVSDLSSASDPMSAGDSVTMKASAGDELKLIWHDPESYISQVVDIYEIPE